MSFKVEKKSTSEIRQHWLFLIAMTAGIFCSSVALPYYSIGALLDPVTTEFNWTRAEFQSAILFSASIGALIAPLMGMAVDRYGTRRISMFGLLGLSLSFLMAAMMDGSLWMFYGAYACMAILGAGTTPIVWTRAISTQFTRQRGLALGIALSGTGICAILAPRFTVELNALFGWRAAYVGLGLIPVLLAIPLVWLAMPADHQGGGVSDRPTHSAGMRLGEAVRGYRFWILLWSIFIVYMAVSGIAPNLIPALTDNGMSAAEAASMQGIFGAAIIAGRLLVGFLIDRFWAPGVAALTLALPVAGCLMLANGVDGFTGLAIALIGLAAGAELDLMSFLCARYFGLRHYARIYALLYSVLAVCSGLAPRLFAMIYDATGTYTGAFLSAAALFGAGALLILLMGRYPTPSDEAGREQLS